MALITAAQFRAWYPLLTGTSEDTAIDTVIDAVSALMARTCGFPRADDGTYTLEAATYTRYIDCPHRKSPRVLDLGVWPVVSVTSAHVDPMWDYGADTAVDAGDMVLDEARGWLWLDPGSSSAWASAARANKVVISAGFATTPDDLAWLCAQAVRHAWDRRRVQGVQSHQMQGEQQTLADTDDVLPEAVRRGLYTYTVAPR